MPLRVCIYGGLLCGVVVAGLFLGHRTIQQQRMRSAAFSQQLGRLRKLEDRIIFWSIQDPTSFRKSVGTGIVIIWDGVPSSILTNLSVDEVNGDTNAVLADSFGNPLDVKITTGQAGTAGTANSYVLLIWSNGPNGVNEMGKGDDMVQSRELQVSP
jgi:hypothetical protein